MPFSAENDLIPIYENEQGERIVYSTELHEKLKVNTNHRDWIKRRIEECNLMENLDYQLAVKNDRSKEYILTVDAAKHISMLQRDAFSNYPP